MTKNINATNLTLGDQFINDSIRTIYNLRGGKWWFLEDTVDIPTIASTRGYQVPDKFRKIQDVYVAVQGSGTTAANATIYMPEAVYDPYHWKLILAYQMGTSDTPYFYYRENNKILFAPIPASDGNVVTIRGRVAPADLNIADYATGTIVSVPFTTTFTAIVASGATSATLSGAWAFTTGLYQIIFSNGEVRLATLTNGLTAATWADATTSAATASITIGTSTGGSIVTAAGTTFTADMIGRFIRITQTTAALGGDGRWYEIGAFYDATHIALVKQYEGTNIAAGAAAFTIGQMTLIPQAYDVAPVYRAVALYFQQQGDLTRAKTYWLMYDGGYEAGYTKIYGGLIGQMLENEGEQTEGAYIPPFSTTANIVNTGAWWSPWQGNASGF